MDNTGGVFTLSGRTLLGRAPTCAVCLHDPRVSSEHAAVSWREAGWWVRDLASRNGTTLDGRPLPAGLESPWPAGVSLSLGGIPVTLLDGGPPLPSARDLDSGALYVARGDVLALPDEESPLGTVVPTDDGWRLEGDEGRPVADRDEVQVGGRRYRLYLPTTVAPTVTAAELALTFRVSADEEHVSVEVASGARRVALRPRTHLYLLLTLARARCASTHRDPAERGWVQRDDLARQLRCDRTTVNVQLHRVRLDLGAHGLEGAQSLLEVRTRSGQVRLGTDAVQILRP